LTGSEAVGVIVFLGLLAWVFALSVVLVVAQRRVAASATSMPVSASEPS
jgi:hypothetical protein